MSALPPKLLDLYYLAMHHALRHAPVEAASALGGLLVRTNVRLNRPEIITGARRNLARHRPHMSAQDIDRALWRFADNVGRHMGECSALDRMIPQDRIEIMGHEHLRALRGRRPALALQLHTGNWEMFGPALTHHGIPPAAFYEPPESPAQRRIIEEVRRRAGFTLLPPDTGGLRKAIALLKDNQLVSIGCDEARAGQLMAPLFGRRPHDKGNLAIAAKLARRTGALIVTGHCVRLERCRFRLHICEPFALPDPGGGLLEDVRFLNERIEPIILSHLDQWYFLDDEIEEIA